MKFIEEALKEVKEAIRGMFSEEEKGIRRVEAKRILGYELYEEQKRWVEYCFKEERKKIKLLLGARGYGKTEVITIYGTVRYIIEKLRNNPKVIILTRQQDRVKGIIRAIKVGLIECGVRIRSTSNLIRLEKNNSKEANIMGLTINSRGIRGNHVDIVIMDDPVIALDEKSLVERQTVKSMFTQEELQIIKEIAKHSTYLKNSINEVTTSYKGQLNINYNDYANSFNNYLVKLQESWGGNLSVILGRSFLPYLTTLINKVANVIFAFNEFIEKMNQQKLL